jgi:LmbE family N-acetylglucosaminyl deacetylase
VPNTVLALAPHPDDAEFYAGGLLAGLAMAGAQVYLVVVSDGRCGSFEHSQERLISLRAEEMRRAAAALGAQSPLLLGYPDFALDRLPAGELRERFIRLIRQLQPDLLVAEDPYAPGEPHPDHRTVAWAALEAVSYAALPLIHPEHLAEGLPVHFTAEKYFYSNTGVGANRIMDVSAGFPRKIAALAEHRSQVAFLVESILRQAQLAGLARDALMARFGGDPLAALAWALETQAIGLGQQIGVRYGEAYRYVRFDPLVEEVLAAN